MFEIMENKKILITLIDTDNYRNHVGARSQLILTGDRIMHEAISECDCYADISAIYNGITPLTRPYYIREVYKKEAVAGVSISNCFHERIDKEVYNLTVSIMGASDDIIIRFYDRKNALELYKEINEWMF